jgi:molybdenum cofactor guanylyltransferase
MRAPRSRCGVLLAGGASARFAGPPKGLAPFGAARLADIALAALVGACDRVVIAANDPDAERWFPEHQIVRDVLPGRGALSALETAMLSAGDDTVVVCAWDMPFVTAALLDTLAIAVERGACACVPQHSTGVYEPLCASYHPSCASVVVSLLATGERAAYTLVGACHAEAWPIAAADEDVFFNVNTLDDLTRADGLRAMRDAVMSS